MRTAMAPVDAPVPWSCVGCQIGWRVGRAGELLKGTVGTYTRAGALAAGEGVAVAVTTGERLLDVLTAVECHHQAVRD